MKTLEQMLAADFGTLGELIAIRAAERPDHLALVMEDGALTYAELDRLMNRVGTALRRDGIGQTEAISVCATTSLEYAALFLGALRVGVAVAPLAPSSTPEQLAGMVADCKARLFFSDRGVAEAMAPVADQVPCRRIALDGQAFVDWLAPEGSKPRPVEIEPSMPFNIIYSSGT
ncbi:MAG: AMP-binding protein, partial [Ignavibacteriales bacterium]